MALPRTRGANARNDKSRSCCVRTSSARITPVATTMTTSDFMAAMTTEESLLTMDGSVLRRLSPNSSPAHSKSCDDEASGSRPDPGTNTSHRRLKMFHSSGVLLGARVRRRVAFETINYRDEVSERRKMSVVFACLLYDSLPGVLVFGCAARCNG